MNRINFQQSIGFPLETNTLHEMQNTYSIFNELGEITGNKSIIKGCIETGQDISDGIVYINGELLEFKGGLKQSTIIIVEEITQVEFEDGQSRDTYFKRYAKFGSGIDSIAWSELKRIDNLQVTKNNINTLNNRINVTNNNVDTLENNTQTNFNTLENQFQSEINTLETNIQNLQNQLNNTNTKIQQLEVQTIHKEVKWVGRNVTNRDLPNNWFIANGQNGTDNILGKMIVGYNSSEIEFDTIGKTGGEKEVVLTVPQLPRHGHRLTIGGTSLNWWDEGDNRLSGHDHEASDNSNLIDTLGTGITGEDQPHNNLPPYITMLPIQFIKP
ncbi:phage baseplate protein [Tenacibaculum jejuense]|uniref:Putative Phage tail collar domain family protein n=1 Tax=Tenacibaculum jejuense TaxID=584609 RepID=A0A238UBK5_9FLAO|nr:hypothetical protein [Tenacibaculum jejuense]SNR16541.1 putative Phage tail collar domain family protein [Tenacibaculum jejuense]